MLRSMFTAISALSLHQSYMDVVADNLANANTPGFKSSRITFQDQFAQLLAAGSSPTTGLGGINPTQIGLGVRLGSINASFLQGTLQGTGRVMDVAIQGDGFYIYTDGTTRFYSRDGALEMDAEGMLVNSSTGMRLLGWMADASGTVDPGLPIGELQMPIDSTLARATANVIMTGNLDSTSPLATAYNCTVGVYDSLGVLHPVTLAFTRTGANAWAWSATSGATGSGTVTFDTDGQYTAGGGSITVPAGGGAAATTAALDMSILTQLATSGTVAAASQDGLAAGSLTGFNVISNTGEIFGTYSNGLQQRIGQIALATFVNPAGLVRHGQNLFLSGLNSGDAAVGTAGSGGRGTLISGYLEASNVDMAQEFTNMILAQRGFQASSRVITASDEMLQELVNLIR